ncbi:hypothetical protein ACJMK2_024146 [Sinanodonta woodiana]|uniref:Rap guanine nucleotide exchange factor 4 n=1 Tax=Sinanodonta woodiana TaxID=1069815 RepID=A0ABD3T7A9_SINWO
MSRIRSNKPKKKLDRRLSKRFDRAMKKFGMKRSKSDSTQGTLTSKITRTENPEEFVCTFLGKVKRVQRFAHPAKLLPVNGHVSEMGKAVSINSIRRRNIQFINEKKRGNMSSIVQLGVEKRKGYMMLAKEKPLKDSSNNVPSIEILPIQVDNTDTDLKSKVLSETSRDNQECVICVEENVQVQKVQSVDENYNLKADSVDGIFQNGSPGVEVKSGLTKENEKNEKRTPKMSFVRTLSVHLKNISKLNLRKSISSLYRSSEPIAEVESPKLVCTNSENLQPHEMEKKLEDIRRRAYSSASEMKQRNWLYLTLQKRRSFPQSIEKAKSWTDLSPSVTGRSSSTIKGLTLSDHVSKQSNRSGSGLIILKYSPKLIPKMERSGHKIDIEYCKVKVIRLRKPKQDPHKEKCSQDVQASSQSLFTEVSKSSKLFSGKQSLCDIKREWRRRRTASDFLSKNEFQTISDHLERTVSLPCFDSNVCDTSIDLEENLKNTMNLSSQNYGFGPSEASINMDEKQKELCENFAIMTDFESPVKHSASSITCASSDDKHKSSTDNEVRDHTIQQASLKDESGDEDSLAFTTVLQIVEPGDFLSNSHHFPSKETKDCSRQQFDNSHSANVHMDNSLYLNLLHNPLADVSPKSELLQPQTILLPGSGMNAKENYNSGHNFDLDQVDKSKMDGHRAKAVLAEVMHNNDLKYDCPTICADNVKKNVLTNIEGDFATSMVNNDVKKTTGISLTCAKIMEKGYNTELKIDSTEIVCFMDQEILDVREDEESDKCETCESDLCLSPNKQVNSNVFVFEAVSRKGVPSGEGGVQTEPVQENISENKVIDEISCREYKCGVLNEHKFMSGSKFISGAKKEVIGKENLIGMIKHIQNTDLAPNVNVEFNVTDVNARIFRHRRKSSDDLHLISGFNDVQVNDCKTSTRNGYRNHFKCVHFMNKVNNNVQRNCLTCTKGMADYFSSCSTCTLNLDCSNRKQLHCNLSFISSYQNDKTCQCQVCNSGLKKCVYCSDCLYSFPKDQCTVYKLKRARSLPSLEVNYFQTCTCCGKEKENIKRTSISRGDGHGDLQGTVSTGNRGLQSYAVAVPKTTSGLHGTKRYEAMHLLEPDVGFSADDGQEGVNTLMERGSGHSGKVTKDLLEKDLHFESSTSCKSFSDGGKDVCTALNIDKISLTCVDDKQKLELEMPLSSSLVYSNGNVPPCERFILSDDEPLVYVNEVEGFHILDSDSDIDIQSFGSDIIDSSLSLSDISDTECEKDKENLTAKSLIESDEISVSIKSDVDGDNVAVWTRREDADLVDSIIHTQTDLYKSLYQISGQSHSLHSSKESSEFGLDTAGERRWGVNNLNSSSHYGPKYDVRTNPQKVLAHSVQHIYDEVKSTLPSDISKSEPSLRESIPDKLISRDFESCELYAVNLGYLLYTITCDDNVICIYSLQRNKQLMEGVITPIASLSGCKYSFFAPSEKLVRAGHVLRTVLLTRAPHMIRDRKFHLRTYRRCMVGTEMVDWLLQQCSLAHSRNQAIGMWQALVEEGIVVHVCHEHQFKDKYLFYRFHDDDQGINTVLSTAEKKECEDELQDILLMLAQTGPDAMMRMILRKLPHERTVDDLEIIYEELLHIKALSHLSTMVKRELASVLLFESHAKAGTVLFNQGDEGKSWYIILKGSVNIVIYGKGVVCTLHEGDDFGKLALVNDAPRAATIVLREDNCHFLRVEKDDFNRILRDVEANTVRLKEHGQDVLILEKIPTNTQAADGTVQAHYKYSVMAGTPEKMLEHLLETRVDSKVEEDSDAALEDFLLTHVIFMPTNHLCPTLLSHYHAEVSPGSDQEALDYTLTHKKCVLHFVQEWVNLASLALKGDLTFGAFLEELHNSILDDLSAYPCLSEDLDAIENILEWKESESPAHEKPLAKKKNQNKTSLEEKRKRQPIKPSDENIFKVYCADHTYSTLRLPMDSTVQEIVYHARDKLCLGDDLVLCEVKSTGERRVLKENDMCITSGLGINSRLFISPREHLDALTPLPEQDGPSLGSLNTLELMSSKEMAYHMTVYDWELFSCVHEFELIYQVFGRYKFKKITANLDLFLKRFNEVQYWVVTEMVLATNLSKRVSLLRKFVKLAAYCKQHQNLNSFFAIVMGLSNIAVSRLSQTWEKLPGRFKKMFADFETLMDPSRNHRVYRLSITKMSPPIIPFMPLLMKDMTFTHEGNKTYFDGLVNFEKTHMIAQTLKTIRFCRMIPMELENPGPLKTSPDNAVYIRNLQVIDNQRLLTQLSHKLEPRKT